MAFDPSTAKAVGGFDPSSAKPDTAAPVDDGKEPTNSETLNSLYTALHSAADTSTFGVADRASAGIASGVSHLTSEPLSYDEAYQRIKANTAKSAGNHPVAALAGDVAGMVAGAGALSTAAKAAEALPVVGNVARAAGDALALKAGAPVANVAKAATVGAGFGAADAAGHGGDADQIGLSALGGAVAGPILGKFATSAIKALSPATTKAMSLLADKIGETPDVLQRAYVNFQAATGRVPTMAEIVGLKSSGELRQVAGGNPIVGEAATQAAATANMERATTLPDFIEKTTGQPPQDISGLTQSRKVRMDAAMKPIRTQPVDLDSKSIGPLYDPRARAATNGDPALRARISAAIEGVEEHGSDNSLTVDDMDSIRKSVRGRQSAYANPQATIHNPHTAESYGHLADDITGLATGGSATHPYQAALDQFEADSHFIKGFKHGMAGKDIGEASDPSLINSLEDAEGRKGYASGVQSHLQADARSSEAGATRTAASLGEESATHDQLRTALGPQAAARLQSAGSKESAAADRLNTIAPGAPAPPLIASGQHLAQAGAAVLSHSPAAIAYHIGRTIPRASKAMSPAVQQKVAQYLLDPSMTQQGINLLRKAGATNADIRRLALAISGNVGGNAGEAMAGN